MTASAFPTQAQIEAALSVLRMAGYTVRPGKSASLAPAPVSVSLPDFGAIPNRKSYQTWDRAYVLLTFADGEVVGAYAMREPGKSGWFLGSAVRAAAEKYRWRRTPNMPDVDAERLFQRKISVPAVTEVFCDDEAIEVDLGALNAATETYRAAYRHPQR